TRTNVQLDGNAGIYKTTGIIQVLVEIQVEAADADPGRREPRQVHGKAWREPSPTIIVHLVATPQRLPPELVAFAGPDELAGMTVPPRIGLTSDAMVDHRIYQDLRRQRGAVSVTRHLSHRRRETATRTRTDDCNTLGVDPEFGSTACQPHKRRVAIFLWSREGRFRR